MRHPLRRRGPSRAEVTAALWIIVMFDNVIALFKKLNDDDGSLDTEIAALEKQSADLKAQADADDTALADIGTRLTALEATVAALPASAPPIDTSGFALKTDLAGLAQASDVTALGSRITALQAEMDDLDTHVGQLSGGPPPPAPAPGPVSTLTVDLSGAPTSATLGQPYTGQVAAAGGVGAPTFSVDNGLPPGLAMSAVGTISGTPTQDGAFSATITAHDGNGDAGTAVLGVTVADPATQPAPAPADGVDTGGAPA